MNELYLLARVTHVVLGAVWVGAIFLAAFFLMPAVAEAGPDGAKVMAGIVRRNCSASMRAATRNSRSEDSILNYEPTR